MNSENDFYSMEEIEVIKKRSEIYSEDLQSRFFIIGGFLIAIFMAWPHKNNMVFMEIMNMVTFTISIWTAFSWRSRVKAAGASIIAMTGPFLAVYASNEMYEMSSDRLTVLCSVILIMGVVVLVRARGFLKREAALTFPVNNPESHSTAP